MCKCDNVLTCKCAKVRKGLKKGEIPKTPGNKIGFRSATSDQVKSYSEPGRKTLNPIFKLANFQIFKL